MALTILRVLPCRSLKATHASIRRAGLYPIAKFDDPLRRWLGGRRTHVRQICRSLRSRGIGLRVAGLFGSSPMNAAEEVGLVSGGPSGKRALSPAYSAYVVTLMAAIYFFYMVDRNAIMVYPETSARFRLSDSMVGMLTGAFYGFAYAIAGIPMGWAVDRSNRAKLLGGMVAIWAG